jgi:hypothetical protein
LELILGGADMVEGEEIEELGVRVPSECLRRYSKEFNFDRLDKLDIREHFKLS